jgi:hypothetical protein
MAEFSALDEAFFRSGEQLSEVPVAEVARPTWWRRLLQPELRGWSPLVDEGDPESAATRSA